MGEAKRVYHARDGVRRTGIIDPDRPDDLIVHTEQDIEPILESIKRDREIMTQRGHNKVTHRIPTFIYEQLHHRGIAQDPDRFRAWLNSSEATPWRLWEGSI